MGEYSPIIRARKLLGARGLGMYLVGLLAGRSVDLTLGATVHHRPATRSQNIRSPSHRIQYTLPHRYDHLRLKTCRQVLPRPTKCYRRLMQSPPAAQLMKVSRRDEGTFLRTWTCSPGCFWRASTTIRSRLSSRSGHITHVNGCPGIRQDLVYRQAHHHHHHRQSQSPFSLCLSPFVSVYLALPQARRSRLLLPSPLGSRRLWTMTTIRRTTGQKSSDSDLREASPAESDLSILTKRETVPLYHRRRKRAACLRNS